jgi:hypothetical protein
MTPDALFQIANPLAMVGWIALVAAPLAPKWSDRIAIGIALLLSLGYTALLLAFWTLAEGGFDSLPNVMLLFDTPQAALAGWVHYLAFDLFIGAWIVRTARIQRIPHLLVLPCLIPAFLFGPAGLLAFFGLRAVFALRARSLMET